MVLCVKPKKYFSESCYLLKFVYLNNYKGKKNHPLHISRFVPDFGSSKTVK